jgi:hypothetical protein
LTLTLTERATKIRETIQTTPTATVQANKQFYDDVWNFCGAVIDASEQGGQFVAPSIMGN